MSCNSCGGSISSGGEIIGGKPYCSPVCAEKGGEDFVKNIRATIKAMPQEDFDNEVKDVHLGQCPRCNGSGPVDIHTSHQVWSLIILTSWSSKPQLSCRSCGVKSKIGGIFYCLVLGWWGFPFGIIATPIQIARNFFGIFITPNPLQPSVDLQEIVKSQLEAKLAQQLMLEDAVEQEKIQ